MTPGSAGPSGGLRTEQDPELNPESESDPDPMPNPQSELNPILNQTLKSSLNPQFARRKSL